LAVSDLWDNEKRPSSPIMHYSSTVLSQQTMTRLDEFACEMACFAAYFTPASIKEMTNRKK
jgi:hypothetical protein